MSGLSDEEIEYYTKQPLRDRKKVYERAHAWLDINYERWAARHPGKHITLNARDLTFEIAEAIPQEKLSAYDATHRRYFERFGPLPRGGWEFLDVDLLPR